MREPQLDLRSFGAKVKGRELAEIPLIEVAEMTAGKLKAWERRRAGIALDRGARGTEETLTDEPDGEY